MSNTMNKPILTIKNFRPDFHTKYQVTTIFMHVDECLTQKYYPIDFDVFLPSKGVNLQRAFVWTEQQSAELIISILKGISIPAFSAIMLTNDKIDRNNRVIQIIDGKQRIMSIIKFIRDEFQITVNGYQYLYSELPSDLQYVVSGFHVTGNMMYQYTSDATDEYNDNQKIEFFTHVNFAGTPQEQKHINLLTKLRSNEK